MGNVTLPIDDNQISQRFKLQNITSHQSRYICMRNVSSLEVIASRNWVLRNANKAWNILRSKSIQTDVYACYYPNQVGMTWASFQKTEAKKKSSHRC